MIAILSHYDDVIMGTMASQITSLTIVYSTVYSDADQRKHKSSAEFPAQKANNTENISIWWRHHDRAPQDLSNTFRYTYILDRHQRDLILSASANVTEVLSWVCDTRHMYGCILSPHGLAAGITEMTQHVIMMSFRLNPVNYSDITRASWCLKSPAT